MTDLKVTLLDGSFMRLIPVSMAFRMAAIFAFREGVPKRKAYIA
jgi:translation elongation factor EF-G